MKNDNALKKHHFWLLLGFVPLFTLIGMFTVSSSVGGEIAKKEGDVRDAKNQIQGKLNPKTNYMIERAKKLVDEVSSQQGKLHNTNWERQKHLFTWPANSKLLKEIEQKNLKFGDPLPTDRGEFDEFRKTEVYIYEFSSLNKKDGTYRAAPGMADRVAPTQFKGGWEQVLRHVTDFGQAQITKDQVWLMMEDIWIQRSLLDGIRSINEEMSAFRRAKHDKDGTISVDPSYDEKGNKLTKNASGNLIKVETPDEEKRKALFRNRTWAVELELIKEGNDLRLGGTLTNLTDRLQLMGTGNMMVLNVWFSKDPAAEPRQFRIGGEFLPGVGANKTALVPELGPDGKPRKDRDGKEILVEKVVPANVLNIVPLDEHIIPPTINAEEIVRVEQVFDIRTVPVKRIDHLALGKPDSRHGDDVTLLPPQSPPFEKEKEAEPTSGTPSGTDSLGPMGSATGPPGGMRLGTGGTGGTATAKKYGGGGAISTVIDGNKKRYLVVNDQVRRMPVGIVVVVDQAYMQDVLLAFANSPLRFQITQVTWTRFRGTLTGLNPGGSTGEPGGGIDYRAGTVTFSGPGDPDTRPTTPRPGPVSPMGPMGPIKPGTGGGPPGTGMGTYPSGYPGPSFPGSGSTGSTVSESQITSGLVELSVYGLVSLYEKYVEPAKPDEAKTDPKVDPKAEPKADPKADPKTDPKGPSTPDPKQGDPKQSMPPMNGTPKMRRRVRG